VDVVGMIFILALLHGVFLFGIVFLASYQFNTEEVKETIVDQKFSLAKRQDTNKN
tara:strand:+ start:142 stop:306 length:165 start_codon:yes stop_codon:yes gene_type:complete